eukprot:scaffold41514_cov60-Phaeocystis_antarctica.AAC.4
MVEVSVGVVCGRGRGSLHRLAATPRPPAAEAAFRDAAAQAAAAADQEGDDHDPFVEAPPMGGDRGRCASRGDGRHLQEEMRISRVGDQQ